MEINKQIETLLKEQENILQSLLLKAEPELLFNDKQRRIHWNGNSIKLGKKSYEFIKILWQGDDHQAELIELEENIWTQSIESETFVPQSTIIMLVRHVQKNLNEVHFPYKIEAVKNFSANELEGFKLVLHRHKK